MKLIGTPQTVSTARVDYFLAEKGLELDKEIVDLRAGVHKTPEYRARVPNGRTPALELDDGTIICETMAICRYIEAIHPEPNLFGLRPEQQGLVEMWNRMMEFEVMLPMAMCFRHTHPGMKMAEDQVPEWGEKQRVVAVKRLKRLDKTLADQAFVAGDALTVADITAYCALRFFQLSGFAPADDQPNLQRWYDAMASRPAAKAAYGDKTR